MIKNVYFKPFVVGDNQEISDIAGQLLNQLIATEGIKLNNTVPIKVHFGEKGNVTYVPASSYQGIIDCLNSQGATSAFIETNVLYRGARTTRTSHEALAKDHGFTQLPVIIADGDHGEAFQEIVIQKDYFETCKIGAGFEPYKQIIVSSHFKGHGQAGFGGAVKQLSMGFAARGGKMAQHSQMVPTIHLPKCTACGLCIQKCDVDAIQISSATQKAEIDGSKCIGCAGCIAVCPFGAVRNDWNGQNFKEKMAEYAYAAQLGKEFIYINFLMNITAECDCMGTQMEIISKDVGVLASLDPVAIDRACLDLLKASHGHPLFEEGTAQLTHGEAIGLGSSQYNLITIE